MRCYSVSMSLFKTTKDQQQQQQQKGPKGNTGIPVQLYPSPWKPALQVQL